MLHFVLLTPILAKPKVNHSKPSPCAVQRHIRTVPSQYIGAKTGQDFWEASYTQQEADPKLVLESLGFIMEPSRCLTELVN